MTNQSSSGRINNGMSSSMAKFMKNRNRKMASINEIKAAVLDRDKH